VIGLRAPLRVRGREGKPAQPPSARGTASKSARLGLVGLASILVALSLYTMLSSQPGRYIPDAHIDHVWDPGGNLAGYAYLWEDAQSIGKPRQDFSPATAAFQAALGALGTQPWLIERLTSALYLSLAALGVILLLREFRPRIDLAHAIAAFVYTFSPFTSQFLLSSPLFLIYALAPWFAWFALRGVRDRDPWRWAAAFALAIGAVGTFNTAALGYALLPAALIGLYVSFHELGRFTLLWRWTWRAGLLSALIWLPALVVLLFSQAEISANLRITELPESVARTSSWSESWRGLGFWVTYLFHFAGGLDRPQAAPYFTAPEVIAASFLASLGALITLALGRWRYRLLFGTMLLVSLVLMVGIHDGTSPLGRLLSFSFDHWGFAKTFRNTYKAGAGLMLALAVLLGVGMASAVSEAVRSPGGDNSTQPARVRHRRLALGFLLPVLVFAGLLVASFPFWTHRLYSDDTGFKSIPPYWNQAFDYLGEQKQPGRVLVLPSAEDARYRWGSVQDSLFDAFSPITPLLRRPLPQGTAESADLIAAINEYVSSPSYVKGTLGPILSRLGVRWVFLQNDLDWQRIRVPRPSTYDALRDDPDLRLAATFGRRGTNTAALGDLGARLRGERSLPPVELYRVAGAPLPLPRLLTVSPLLVAGGGDSWPALAGARLLGGPPIAYTGAVPNDALREMAASASGLVVTDGNRKRETATTNEAQFQSPTLAPGEPTERRPADLFERPGSQSVATYANVAWISASRYGFPLSTYEASSRPASAFDGVERTAWTVRGPVDSDGESITVKLRKPRTITGVSVLTDADGPWRIRAVDMTMHSEDGGQTRQRLRFAGAPHEPARARVEATGVAEIELRIAQVDGPGPVGLAGVGIAEVGVATPNGPLDLREFVRTPDDLAIRAAGDGRLAAELAARPPRYELRRVTGTGAEDEETELRREINTFGHHRYELGVTARINRRATDDAIDALLGAPVGAVGTSRFGGEPKRRGGLALDGDLSTGWEPEPRAGQRIDLRFPTTEVSSVEVLLVSGPQGGVARSRVTGVDVAVGEKNARTSAHSSLPRSRQCERVEPLIRGCLETHQVNVQPTDTDRLSVTLTKIDPVVGPFGKQPPRVVEVRINGRDLSPLATPTARRMCAPLLAVDGRAVGIRLPRDPDDVLAGKRVGLKGCEPIQLGPGSHRVETLSGLSGAALTASLRPFGEKRPAPHRRGSREPADMELVDSSPTQLDVRVDAPEGATLVGGMPWHQGWIADGGHLRRSSVPLDTFAAWTVEAATDGPVALRFNPQKYYELAIALSIATAAWCLWRVMRRRRRRAS
jgi:arabinofuranan 3-O-arabinosyltransferase